MVRVVRTPSFSKRIFTPSQLSGWASGVKFSYTQKARARRRKIKSHETLVKEAALDEARRPQVERVDDDGTFLA